MIQYFGYGSNMRRVNLRVKGVESLSSEPALLKDWRLAFNLAHPFPFEGCVANIVPATGSAVHGALCAFEDEYLESLDRFEGLGVVYERRELEVWTYRGDTKTAYAYVGLPAKLQSEGKPSLRYRNILVEGGRDVGLADEYLNWLANVPVHPAPDYPPFVPPKEPTQVFTLAQLARQPLHAVLAGHVFDMSGAGPEHVILRSLIKDQDVTLFFLQQMDSSVGTETADDIASDRLSGEQRRYLNDYLHEFSRVYTYVGRLA